MDPAPNSSELGSPSCAGSNPRHGRLQYWVDMANGPGFDVGSIEPPDDEGLEEDADDRMIDKGLSSSLHEVPSGSARPSGSPSNAASRSRRLSSATAAPRVDRIEAQPDSSPHSRQVHTRAGKLQVAEDGHQRYFGATSNLHLVHNGPYSCFSPSFRDIRVDGDVAIKNAGLEWIGDPEYEQHLLDCYFTWVNPLTSLVDRGLFDQARGDVLPSEGVELYSPALENAMLSIGAIHTTRQHTSIKRNACEFFAARAKIYLDLELQSPTIATLQGLVLLCEHEAAQGRDSQGWIYSGIATRIVSDLGLLPTSPHPDQTKDHHLAVPDAKARVFWSVVYLDTIWASWCGRPPAIPDKDIFAPNVPIPKAQETTSSGASRDVHRYLSGLMNKFSNMMRTIYHDPYVSLATLSDRALQIDESLRHWRLLLPRPLGLESTRDEQTESSAVFQLNLVYHEIRILLHRPFFSQSPLSTDAKSVSSGSRPTPPSPASRSDNRAARPHEICTASASEILRLMGLFKDRFGLCHLPVYFVHVLMTAGMMCAYNTSIPDATRAFQKESASLTLTSIGMMRELSGTYPVAQRSLEILTSLRREWQDCQAGLLKKRSFSSLEN